MIDEEARGMGDGRATRVDGGNAGRMAKGLAIAFSCVRYNTSRVGYYEIDTHSTGTDQTDQS